MRRLSTLAVLLFQSWNSAAWNAPQQPSVVDVQSVINAALGLTGAVSSVTDAFTAGAPFALSHQPAATPVPAVYLNGILQLAVRDYLLTGQTLTFTASDLGDSPTVQVLYWASN